MECKVIGAVKREDVEGLGELLLAISGRPGTPYSTHEVVIKGPQQERTVPVEVRLIRSLSQDHASKPSTSNRWAVVHEGLPMRGKAATDLPASVRGVVEAQCSGASMLPFWAALGFTLEYECVREGRHFVVPWKGQEIQVRVLALKRLATPRDISSAVELTPEFQLVEVWAIVDGEQAHVHASQAIGTLAEALKKFVELRKPSSI